MSTLQLRHGILLAMGLGGCAAETLELDPTDPEALARLTLHPTATVALAVDELAWQADRIGAFDIASAAPDARYYLLMSETVAPFCPTEWAGECADMVYPAELVAHGAVDGAGAARALPVVPDGHDGAPRVYQVLTVDGDQLELSAPVRGTISDPVRDCGEHHEVAPGEVCANGDVRFVCLASSGACDPTWRLSTWDAKVAWSDATGNNLPPGVTVTATCRETTFTDACCYRMRAVNNTGGAVGRPFDVGGEARVASAGASAGWCEDVALDTAALPSALRERLVGYWSRIGADEHASVASFSRFNLELLALGAPAHLLAASTRAIGDEIAHARIAWGLAGALAGTRPGAGPLAVDRALDRSSDPEAVLLAAIREGCLNETVCAAQARAAAEGAADPQVRALLARVADDEARHAELSWAFVRWLLGERPELASAARAAFAAWSPGPAPARDPERDALLRFGMPTPDLEHEIAVAVGRDVIGPCAAALFGAPGERADLA